MKFWNWLRDETTGERILRLEGVIADDSWLNDTITPKQFRDELNAGKGDVVIWINSEGGDVFAAAQIYNMLREYSNRRGKVTVRIDALAASAASVVAMAGDVVEISPVGSIFIHDPWTLATGNSAEMTATAKMLDEIKESIINAYQQKTKLPRAEISRLMEQETWLHSGKAIELGFADGLINDSRRKIGGISAAKLSSRRQVMNALRTALAKTAEPDNQTSLAAESLRRRLSIGG